MKNNIYGLIVQQFNMDYDIYNYGYEIIINYSIFLILIVLFSLFFGILCESILFLIAYIPLKRYIGGFHLREKHICTFFSIICTIIASLLSSITKYNDIIYIIGLMGFTLLIVNHYGIQVPTNKNISNSAIKQYFKKSMITLFLYTIGVTILLWLGSKLILSALITAVSFILIEVLISKWLIKE